MTQPEDERLRIRGYLQAQAAKLSPRELMEKVRADGRQLAEAAAAADAVDQERRPSPEDWSVNEVMSHVYGSCARINADMVGVAFEGARPGAVADRIETATESRRATEWVERLFAEREATFAKMASLEGNENIETTWSHPFFGDLNWREWLLFLRLHDLDHAGQIRGIVAALKSET